MIVVETDQHKKRSVWTLFVDGASRNNPGPSGAGIYLLKDGVPVEKDGFYLGKKTNNEAEYFALLIGLFITGHMVEPGDSVHIVSDSQLLVRQLLGLYRVRQPHLKPLHDACKGKMQALSATISHVLREKNKEADEMANQGVDLKKSLPKNFISFLKTHDITL